MIYLSDMYLLIVFDGGMYMSLSRDNDHIDSVEIQIVTINANIESGV